MREHPRAGRTHAGLSLGLACACACACNQAPPAVEGGESDCGRASEVLGHRACVHEIRGAGEWESVSEESLAVGALRQTKLLLPARPDARVDGLFLDAHHERDHYAMLTEGLVDRFGGMTMDEYATAILGGPERELFAGPLVEYVVTGQTHVFGYSIWDDPLVPSAGLRCEQLLDARARLERSTDLRPLLFVPFTEAQDGMARDCDVARYDPGQGVPYEAYSVAEGFGTVRVLDRGELLQAEREGEIGWRDVLVLDEAPLDLAAVVSGVVSGSQQAALAHLNVRSQARGTPSCYVRDAEALLSAWEGELVRLSCREEQWSVTAATLDEAEAFWAGLRPEPVAVPEPDTSTTAMPDLPSLPTATAAERGEAVATYGGKGSALASLYQRYDGPQVLGVLVPFSAYASFMATTTWEVDLGEGPVEQSFEQTLRAWLEDPAFTGDGVQRRARLEALRAAMEASSPDPEQVAAIAERVVQVWGRTDRMLRFRSSSNAEDSLRFSGAGLYESTSVCVADSLDDDEVGPSCCDPDEPQERTIERGLVRVWASLWSMGAFEERSWYGIDHSRVAMGVLVNERSEDERANAVAFTGNPTAPADPRWLINAQIGDLDVVAGQAGVVPERVLLRVSEGVVESVLRVGSSSELPSGVGVLSEAQLLELGSRLIEIAEVFPVDELAPEGMRVVLDTEWKLRSDGTMLVKQVRPQLLPALP